MGPNRAVKIFSRRSGSTRTAFGPATKQACDSCAAPDTTAHYCDIREALYRRFAQAPGQDRFLAGWLNRLNDLRVAAGVPGYRRRGGDVVDFGETGYIERVPDIKPSKSIEAW